jgi:hypothetical protein
MYDYNRTWSRLFKKNVLGTKLEIYVSKLQYGFGFKKLI